ncbi:MAG: STAS domain-containing protein [Nitrospirales bacterium]
MQITTESTRDTMTLTLTGRLDFSARRTFSSAIQDGYGQNTRHIILNLQDVKFIDSSGLGMIHRCIMESETKNVKISIINPRQQIHDILELCNMTQYIVESCSSDSQNQLHSSTSIQSPNLLTRDALSIID